MHWVIWLIIIFVCTIIAFKLIKSAIKTFFVMFFIMLVVGGIFAFFVVKDMGKFQEKFPTAEKLFALEENGVIISATTINDLEKTEMPVGFTAEELLNLNNAYDPDDLSSIQGEHYIVFLFNEELFDFETIEIQDKEFTHEEFLEALLTDTPSTFFLKTQMEPEEFADETLREFARKEMLKEGTEEDYRALVMMMGFSHLMEDRGVMFFIEQLKEDNVQVFPKYVVFNVVEKTPNFLLKMLVRDKE